MSALTEATIIVEASNTSGTLVQARAALKQNRKLFILDSCFRNPELTWPTKFLEKGAIRVRDYEDVRTILAVRRLTQIDEITREEHYYLSDEDQCFYLGEYTAQKGYSHSDTNQLIKNLKIQPKHKNTKRWYYKDQAI